MSRNKGGRPPHQPTDASRKQVEAMSSYGIPQEDIARVVGISHTSLRKHYRAELDSAETKANAMVAQNLFKQATKDDPRATTAAIFWMKTRAGWKETQTHEHSGPGGAPIKTSIQVEFIGATVKPDEGPAS